jgi:hypothetical protein
VPLGGGAGAMQSTHFSPPKPCRCRRCEVKEHEDEAAIHNSKRMVEVYTLNDARNCEGG